MTDTSGYEPDVYLYVEKSTQLLYDAQLFETFVLVRPATPAFYDAIQKMSHTMFAKYFEEYYGDHSQVRALQEYDDEPAIILKRVR